MQPAVEAAWIASSVGLLSSVGTVIVAISGFRNNRKIADRTIQAAAQGAVLAVDAARADRLWEKQADAYAAFITGARSYRNALRPLEKRPATDISRSELDGLAAVADNAASLVFIVLRSEATYHSCRAIVSAINRTQDALHRVDTVLTNSQRVSINNDMAQLLREFQVAVRDELEVTGIESSVILSRAPSERSMR